MNIKKNTVVSLLYELRTDSKDGEIIQKIDANNPFVFIFGTNSLIPGFERNIANLKPGDSFAFLLPCEEAYGPANEDALVDIPKTSFFVDGEIDNDMFFEGNAVPMQDSHGNQLYGVITEVKDDSVVMDFNHPLAGDDLFFSGEIINVREASPEELVNGLNENCSSGGCSGCSGGCS